MKIIILYGIITFFFLSNLSSQSWDLYSVDNSNIISNNINSIDVDKYDNILIATSEGISIFKNGEWKNIKKEEIVNSGSISRIKAYDTTIYISQGETNGIYQSQNDYWKLLLDDKNATTLEVVNQDFLLFANRDYLYSYKNNILTQLDTVKFISDILFRKNGDIWFSAINDGYGLYELGKGKINLGENYKFSQILSIVEDKINNVWIATSANTSIQRFDVSNNTWDIYDRVSLPINESSTLINVQCDSNNNIWVLGIFGSNAGDQFLLKKTINGWEKFDFSELFEKSGEFNFLLPNSMCIDSKNNVWIGTNKGLVKFNEAQTTVATFDQSNIKPYPNPTSEFMNIDLQDNLVFSYSILDLNGKIIKQQHQNFQNQITIDTKQLIAGTYFIKLKLSDNTYVQSKFVKE